MDRTRRRIPYIRIGVFAVAVGALVVASLFGLWQLSRSRDYQLFGRVVSRVETSDKVVAITFDDGPTAQFTPGILSVLREKGIHATFFLIGGDIERNPAETRAVIADGHEVGNHTFTHDDMTFASEDKAASEIEKTDAAIRAAGYSGDILFRPPFGKKLWGLPLYLARHDRTTITWDVEPESDNATAADPERITSDVLQNTRPGSIILMHLMYPARETSRQALPKVIDALRERGFRFVTVSELLALQPH